jgi:hypothetical protein
VTDENDKAVTSRERRVNLWVTVVASLAAAVLGSGVGGFFSYRASERASHDAAAQSQTEFVRQQRQSAYLQAASAIAAIQAAASKAIYDSLPYSAEVTGAPGPIKVASSTGPGTNSISALRTSLPAFEGDERQLATLNATIAIVGSTGAVRQFRSLVDQYKQLDGNLYDASTTLAAMPTELTRHQVLAVGKDFNDENEIEHEAESVATKFEDTARADLQIRWLVSGF